MDPVPFLIRSLVRFGLRRAFHRVYWTGPWPPRLPDGPVIAYANHHHSHDGHLAWLLFREWLGRPTTVWMAEWDRFPLFAPVGAQPFPPGCPSRRAATLRRTARRFREAPSTVLVYYPAGELHPPDDGIGAFDLDVVHRLAQLYPDATWWPLAVHVTWRGRASPTALLRGGPPHPADGRERARLERQWNALHSPTISSSHVLLDTQRRFLTNASLSALAPFFERYL